MLTIQNFQRLKNKVIGNTGYYVRDIKPVASIDTTTGKNHSLYWIELTNRRELIMVQLDREGKDGMKGLKEYELKLGTTQRYKTTLHKFELRNIDIVVNKIAKLILQQYVP